MANQPVFLGELQHLAGLKVKTYENLWDNFGTDDYSDTKTSHWLTILYSNMNIQWIAPGD